MGAAAVYAGLMSNNLVTDTSPHWQDTSHAIGLLGVTTTTTGSRLTAIGVEGRVNLNDAGPTSTTTLVHIGTLGYANAYDPASRADNNYFIGVEGRACKTTSSDCGGQPIARVRSPTSTPGRTSAARAATAC
jgi:hypothetical protein